MPRSHEKKRVIMTTPLWKPFAIAVLDRPKDEPGKSGVSPERDLPNGWEKSWENRRRGL